MPERVLPSVSVVVPTRDRADDVMLCVQAACADPATTEVVVVVDGSKDDTSSRLHALARDERRLRIVEAAGTGAAAARCIGAESATGDVVLMLDDDVVVERGTVTGHARRHLGGDADLVVIGYMPANIPATRRPHRFTTEIYAREYEAHVNRWDREPGLVLQTLWGGHVSMRRVLYLCAGARAAEFPGVYHEDRELGVQLLALGAHGRFDRQLAAVHHHARSLDAFLRDARKQGAGRHILHGRHPDVYGPFDLRSFVADLPKPLQRVVILAAIRPRLHHVSLAAGRCVASMAGRTRLYPLERVVAQLLRRMELVRGAHEAAADGFLVSD